MDNISNFLFFIWLFVLSYFFIKLRNHYYRLISNTKKEKLDQILDLLLEKNVKIENEVELIRKELKDQIELSKFHFQKIGLLRYNPFDKSDSNQSFIISLLDKKNNGLILNFIYIKEGLRVYVKKVKNGKGEEYDLSEEEKEAIKKSY